MSAIPFSEHAVDTAALRLFEDCGMAHPNGRVLFSHLERRWRTTGFRRSDLYEALDRLEADGCLRYESADRLGVDVVLRPAGYRRIAHVPLSPGNWPREVLDWIGIVLARKREHEVPGSAPRRRRADQVPGGLHRGRSARIALEGRLPEPE